MPPFLVGALFNALTAILLRQHIFDRLPKMKDALTVCQFQLHVSGTVVFPLIRVRLCLRTSRGLASATCEADNCLCVITNTCL